MHHHLIDFLLPSLQNLGVYGYWVVFLVSALEAVAFIGSVIPGATLVMFAGLIAANGYLHFGDLVWFAAIGAIIGDLLSYYLGVKGAKLFKEENKLFKQVYIEKGEKFFKKYGNASILFGRFTFIRSIVPFVAGLSKMNQKVFAAWAVFSGFAWAMFYLSIGYLFGDFIGKIDRWIARISVTVVGVLFVMITIYLVSRRWAVVKGFVKSFWSRISK